MSVRPTIPMTKFTTISRQHRAHTSVNSFCLLLSILSEAIAQAPIPGDSSTGTVQKLEAVGSKIQMRDVNCIASFFEEHPPIVKDVLPVVNLKQPGSINLADCQISDSDLADPESEQARFNAKYYVAASSPTSFQQQVLSHFFKK